MGKGGTPWGPSLDLRFCGVSKEATPQRFKMSSHRSGSWKTDQQSYNRSFLCRVPEFSFWFPKQVEEELCFTNGLQFRRFSQWLWLISQNQFTEGRPSELGCICWKFKTMVSTVSIQHSGCVETVQYDLFRINSLSDCTLIRACSFTCHSWRSMCRNPRIQFLSISASSSENGFCLKQGCVGSSHASGQAWLTSPTRVPFVPGCTWVVTLLTLLTLPLSTMMHAGWLRLAMSRLTFADFLHPRNDFPQANLWSGQSESDVLWNLSIHSICFLYIHSDSMSCIVSILSILIFLNSIKYKHRGDRSPQVQTELEVSIVNSSVLRLDGKGSLHG